jgi:phytol kinase
MNLPTGTSAVFWISQALIIGSLSLIAYLCGLLVHHGNVLVNYTRKVNFFALFLIPNLVNYLIPYPASPATTTLRTVFFILALAIFVAPIRKRIPFVATMFLSYDRPEDRPFTLLWLVTQLVAGYLVVAPMSAYFTHSGFAQLMFIPILVHGFGDGLAEPVGVRFGKHKYTTRALFTDRRYTRSLEGSACVLVAGLVTVTAFHESFTPAQFWLALAIVPTVMTLAEAASPHTWDTPLMFLAGGLSLLAIKLVA